MSVSATTILEHISAPASIRMLPQSIEVRQPTSVGTAATVVADPEPLLRDALDGLRIMQERLATLSIESDDDRTLMRGAANKTYLVARHYYDLHAQMVESGLSDEHPVVAMCEELAVGLEDVAETAALAGSEEVARSIAQELELAGVHTKD